MTEDKTIKGNLYGVPVTATIKGKPDYTPTTEDIRAGWEYATAVIGDEGTAQFDRWLAEVICMAKADGFDEGWDARVNAETITPTENPYRQGETE